MGKFTVIPQNTFSALQLDAGVILKRFNPANPVAPADEDIVTATTGGIQVSAVPTFSDLGEDVDNVPVNMKEFKHLDSWEMTVTTTGLGTSPELIKLSLGCADIDGENASKIIPRKDLEQTDFSDLWWVGDRADGGCVAVQIKNALSTAGFSLQTTKSGKGQTGLTLTGHVSINAQSDMPMVFYSIDPAPAFDPVTVAAESQTASMFGVPVSDLQTGVTVSGNEITGTVKFLDGDNGITAVWGEGNFLALKFSDLDADATSVKVGLRPTYGGPGGTTPIDDDSGLVEIITDPDKNGIFQIHDKNTQKLKVVQTDGTQTSTQVFDLSKLTINAE